MILYIIWFYIYARACAYKIANFAAADTHAEPLRGGENKKEEQLMKKVQRKNKSFFFLATLLITCCALIVSVLSACNRNNDDTPPAQSGDEVGTYYYDYDGDQTREYTLVLAEELRFTFLPDSGANHMGSYTLADGTLTRTPQDESAASYYPMLRKEMGRLDPALPARALHDRVRGLYPWPGAYLETAGGALKVLFSRAHDEDSGLAPGLVASADKARGLRIACGAGTLEILELQAPGGKRLPADAFLRGHPQTPGAPFAL